MLQCTTLSTWLKANTYFKAILFSQYVAYIKHVRHITFTSHSAFIYMHFTVNYSTQNQNLILTQQLTSQSNYDVRNNGVIKQQHRTYFYNNLNLLFN